MDDEPPLVWASLLAHPPECPERARRALSVARGDRLPRHRYAVTDRLREAARTAHAELRAPAPGDFAAATDLEPEQQAVYAAGAAGYVALFPAPARALDVPTDAIDEPDLGVRFAPGRDLVVQSGDGDVELRRLQIRGREPRVDESLRNQVALGARRWNPAPREVRIVVADVLTLAVADDVVAVDATTAAARGWLTERVAALRSATDGRARVGEHCLDCEHVWNCPAHKQAWQRS